MAARSSSVNADPDVFLIAVVLFAAFCVSATVISHLRIWFGRNRHSRGSVAVALLEN
jgi:hypothetical protein